MRLIDVYEDLLALISVGILVWFVKFMDSEYGTQLTRDQLFFVLGCIAAFVAMLWVAVEPKSNNIRTKVVLYGSVAGAVIGIGLVGWCGCWLPPVPGG